MADWSDTPRVNEVYEKDWNRTQVRNPTQLLNFCLFFPPYKLQRYVKSSYRIRHNCPLETINTLKKARNLQAKPTHDASFF